MPPGSPASVTPTFRAFVRIISLVSIATLGTSYSVHAQSEVTSAEHTLFDDLNLERSSRGIAVLQWDEALASAARDHAFRMAQRNVLSHQLPGEAPVQDRATHSGARFSLIAENIAVAPTPANIHSAWMQSPHHRENILDPQLNVVGIAVVKGGDGLFAVQDFSQSVPDLDLVQQEQKVIANLHAHGLRSTQATKDARKTCEMSRGFAGGHPLSVVRYETADLNTLPEDVEQKLRSGKYRAAAVGACPGGGDGAFTRFKIAVVLY